MRPDGGDPEPDDYGLPRVDVVVPDDARELERDMLAYRREERRRRRRERVRRVTRPLTRFGVAIPIIAGALLVALLSGALMTAFGPKPTPRPTGAQLAPRPSAPPGEVGGLLPDAGVDLVAGESTPTPLQDLRPGVIGIVPPGYKCESVVAEIAGRTQDNVMNFWLVADPRPAGDEKKTSLKELKACAGTAHYGAPLILDDGEGVLAKAYAAAPGSAGAAGTGLTAVFVQPDGVVSEVVQGPETGPELTEKVRALRSG
ncbi:hypothetical protein E1281_29165 [Actinomadura sp. KC345]|uniref:hypothetical protein n=1 Tax=Actinomadura sp. KC345 TaxID=2530371 RepID=UPI00104410BF|nr:hypothetical protein [Actinomadura sp. KC345]TDC45921.1 hypothetical protein E1281_29165 [Actinomadura sp. KC345]